MPTLEFLEKIVKRLDRVDRKSLEQCVQTLAGEKELLVKLLDQVPAGLMMFALDRSLIYLNRRMMHLLNVSDKLLRQAKLEDVLSDRTLAQWVLTALKSQTEHFNETLDVLLPRPMQLDLTLCFEQNGNQTVGVLYATSLTEKERTARQKFQNQNLESLVSLASGVAHEIGNPINSLTIHLQLLAKAIAKIPARDQKNAAESIQAMKDEMARLDTIVRNFLRAARRKPLRFEKVQINQLIEKTLVLLKPELSQAKVKVSTIVDQKLPEFLLDSERIQQVFINLVRNATYAMQKGGKLRIQSTLKDKLCLIEFADSGVGISEQDLPRIFDAYFTTKEEGSGLGLLIVYQIIREHGGRIEVASKPRTGTTFTVILPVRKEKLGLPGPKRGPS